jgi:hypothetical protein
MKVVTNTKLIVRNAKIGQFLSLGALGVLAVGLYISFKMPTKFALSLGALMLGFLMSQVGMYFSNKWGRSPRPDQVIDKSLKGLGREYTIYHFTTPVSHLLVGPSGIWTIMPQYQSGTVIYANKRWKAKGGGFTQKYLRLFGQENIGRPDLEAGAEIDSATRYLKKMLPEGAEIPQVRSTLLFAHPTIDLQLNDAPLPALTPKNFKDFMREESKKRPISDLSLESVRIALPQPTGPDE